MFVSGTNKAEVKETLCHDINLISNWLIDNRLYMHLGITESIIFSCKFKLKHDLNLHVTCNAQWY